jgi:hypothetical protein
MILFGFAQPRASFAMASQLVIVHLAQPGSMGFEV